tara:strand:- start:799 stop:1335 length:537 start_codon:yes stop_codon:yes gene_type:complete
MSDWSLISEVNASGAASTSFTDLTGYKIFKFVFINLDAVTYNAKFEFQGSTDSGVSYNTTMTTTFFYTSHAEDDSAYILSYLTSQDQGQGTAYQSLAPSFGTDSDQCAAGELFLYNPASTVYIKHFYNRITQYSKLPEQAEYYAAGYFNTTSALDAINFKMSTGNFSGTIKQYGLVES